VTDIEAMRGMSEIGLFGVATVVMQGLLAMSLVAGFLLPVILVDMQLVTVLMKGLLAKCSVGKLVKEELLLVTLEEECGREDSSERFRLLSEDPVGELAE
jgi:hypothetical protein